MASNRQVLTMKQMEHLHKLGLDTSNASFQYIEDNNGKVLCIPKEIASNIKDIEDGYVICDAYTLQDVLDMLPEKINKDGLSIWRTNGWAVDYSYFGFYFNYNLLTAAYKILCLCIKKGKLKIQQHVERIKTSGEPEEAS